MSYADDILKHYSFAPADMLKRLADALGEVESEASAPQKKQTGGAKTDPLKEGAKASEIPADFAAADTLLACLSVSADRILAALAENTAKRENLNLLAARRLATERHPKVAARYLTEERPDMVLAERTKVRMEKDGIGYSKAMGLTLAEDPALAERYKGA